MPGRRSAGVSSQDTPALRQSQRVKIRPTPFEGQHRTVAPVGSSRAQEISASSKKKPQPRCKRAAAKRAIPYDSDPDFEGAPVTKKRKAAQHKAQKDKERGKKVERKRSPSVDEYESDSTVRECIDEPVASERTCDEGCSCRKGTGYGAKCIVDRRIRQERCIEELRLRYNLKTGFAARRMVNGIRNQLDIANKSRGPNELFSNRQSRFRMEATIIQYEREEADLDYQFYRTFVRKGAVSSNTAMDPSVVTEEEASQETSTFPSREMHQDDRARSFLSDTTLDLTSTTEEGASKETSTLTTPERSQIVDNERIGTGRSMETTNFSFNTPEVMERVDKNLSTCRKSKDDSSSQGAGASSMLVVDKATLTPLVGSASAGSYRRMQSSTLMDLASAVEHSQQHQIPAFNFDPLPIFHLSNFPTSSLR